MIKNIDLHNWIIMQEDYVQGLRPSNTGSLIYLEF